MVSVDAPWRMSMSGQSTSGCALATGCGSRCDAPEKKLATLSLKEGGLAGGGGAGVGGVAVAVAPGAGGVVVVAAGAGGVAVAVAAGTGVPVPSVLPVHPAARSANESEAAISARSPRFVR